MAQLYKLSSREYIMENILEYLEHDQEMALKGKLLTLVQIQRSKRRADQISLLDVDEKPREIYDYLSYTIGKKEFGCLGKIWADAVAVNYRPKTDDDEKSDMGSMTALRGMESMHFDAWLVRAALARGHSEWLTRERLDSYTIGHPNPIEAWRLLPPGSVGQYDNSCVIWSTLFIVHLQEDLPIYARDCDFTSFNIISEEMRGHIEQEFSDEVTGSEVWPATDWGIAPGKQGLYVYSRSTNETKRLPFE